MSQRTAELSLKVDRVRRLLVRLGRRALLLADTANFAWITGGGRSHINLAGAQGVAAVLVTLDDVFLVADNIELQRMLDEECADLDARPLRFDWWSTGLLDAVTAVVPVDDLASDLAFPGVAQASAADLIAIRNPLTDEEIARYRELGAAVAVALTHAVLHARPGLTEYQLAGLYCAPLRDCGVDPMVALVAVDDRIAAYRHPLPTHRVVERQALLVVSARSSGLHISASRSVVFGAPSRELTQLQSDCEEIDRVFRDATVPGRRLAGVFADGAAAYDRLGYRDGWHGHHQGGPTGYYARDVRVDPSSEGVVLAGQAFAWNPTLPGVKSEDTILVRDDGYELLTATPDIGSLTVR